jgi:hypothetical protein
MCSVYTARHAPTSMYSSHVNLEYTLTGVGFSYRVEMAYRITHRNIVVLKIAATAHKFCSAPCYDMIGFGQERDHEIQHSICACSNIHEMTCKARKIIYQFATNGMVQGSIETDPFPRHF